MQAVRSAAQLVAIIVQAVAKVAVDVTGTNLTYLIQADALKEKRR
jgi:hypothetical protein